VKMLSLIATIGFFASTAAVADARYTATLAQPVAKKELVANGNIWRCEGSTCVLASDPQTAASVRSCHALELQAGTLSAYGTKDQPFDPDKLAKCNANH
jgi:hypothetical protein